MTKIAVFGSAFNPPSLGHKSVIESLSHFDKVLLLPSISHAWGKQMLDYQIRCQLLDAFISDLALENVERSRVEERLHKPDESVTTYAVLSSLTTSFPDADITFVLGPDNLFNFSKFYNAKEITERWNVLACPERVKVRSTDIRNAILQGESVETLTTPSVATLLQQGKYYR
ncbi:nicotinate-nicotinamide nucleotide adenylyltransferase [Vibrio sonorensis]|uniref:nicotinate-nicotinamide nucleotide adenylyltransferase n=1 Tax=Vibrio sonorensis TaxID=1004316 RepID=UPI0008DA330F|nr:nicotinate-nicotinamide nucleotide adenylyltransferase [Vibrio sonorensis]